jgi:hypothetical protein
MVDEFGAVKLADELVEIARTTTDGVTGAGLMEIVHRLLTEAGLPEGEPPIRWSSGPASEPA